ncbi:MULTISPECIES: hypothetical protein [Bacillus]|nr:MULTISPECIES: hypothetical protein [Bacillus]MDU0070583.1 hypothetical protein [Bacillus sp. IG6]MED8018447.1 hypothetical protein [Bacillus glycinifermentans]WKB76617.1 hypothetical protein QYM22_20000 [Bacillus glycinifermentans]
MGKIMKQLSLTTISQPDCRRVTAARNTCFSTDIHKWLKEREK